MSLLKNSNPNDDSTVRCQLDIMDAHRGELFGKVVAYIGDQEVGHVRFSEYPDLYAPGIEEGDEVPRDININYVYVEPEFRRQGIATKMYQKIMEDFPGEKLTSSGTTDEGGEFRNALLQRGVLAAADLGEAEKIVTEMLPILPAGLPRPKLKIVHSISSGWYGQTGWKYGTKDGQNYSDDTTTISIQRRILGHDETLRRVIAHELCHHWDIMVYDKPELEKLGVQTFKFYYRMKNPHGKQWREFASIFNAKYGKDFVTEKSDENYVENAEDIPEYLLLLQQMPNGHIHYQVALRPSGKQHAWLKAHEGHPEYRLLKTKEPAFVRGPGIGSGRWAYVPADNDKREKLKALWAQAETKTASKKASSAKWDRLKRDLLSGIVYHGTTQEIANLIMRDGFRGLEWDEIVKDVLAKYDMTLDQVPDEWRKIMEATGKSYTAEYHTVSTSPAGEVAIRFAGQGGEVPAQIEAYLQGVVSTREVKDSRIAGEPVVIKCQIKNFANTEYLARVQQWITGLERLAASGGINGDFTLDDAADDLWTSYSNFNCKPDELEPLRVIRGGGLELLKRGPLPEGKSASKTAAEETKLAKNATTQINFPDELAAKVRKIAHSMVPKEDLAGDGYENHLHVTIKYGVKEDEDGLIEAVAGQTPFEVTLGKTHVFEPSKSSDGAAVVVIEIHAPELSELHKLVDAAIGSRPDDFEYKSHATLAYVKPEVAEKYKGLTAFDGVRFEAENITLSKRDKIQITIPFGKMKTAASDRTSSLTMNAGVGGFPPVVIIRYPQKGMRWRQVLKAVKQIAGDVAGHKVPWRAPKRLGELGEPMISIFESPWGSYAEQEEIFPQWAAAQKFVMYDILPDGTFHSVGKQHAKVAARVSGDEYELKCLCGNTPNGQGFFPCDRNGEEIDPSEEAGWERLYVCDHCGRIIDFDTRKVVGKRTGQQGLHLGSHKTPPLSNTSYANPEMGEETNAYADIPERVEGIEAMPALEELAPDMFKSAELTKKFLRCRHKDCDNCPGIGYALESGILTNTPMTPDAPVVKCSCPCHQKKTAAYAEAQNQSQHYQPPSGMYKTLKSDPFWEEWELFGDKEAPEPEPVEKQENLPNSGLKSLLAKRRKDQD